MVPDPIPTVYTKYSPKKWTLKRFDQNLSQLYSLILVIIAWFNPGLKLKPSKSWSIIAICYYTPANLYSNLIRVMNFGLGN